MSIALVFLLVARALNICDVWSHTDHALRSWPEHSLARLERKSSSMRPTRRRVIVLTSIASRYSRSWPGRLSSLLRLVAPYSAAWVAWLRWLVLLLALSDLIRLCLKSRWSSHILLVMRVVVLVWALDLIGLPLPDIEVLQIWISVNCGTIVIWICARDVRLHSMSSRLLSDYALVVVRSLSRLLVFIN